MSAVASIGPKAGGLIQDRGRDGNHVAGLHQLKKAGQLANGTGGPKAARDFVLRDRRKTELLMLSKILAGLGDQLSVRLTNPPRCRWSTS